MRPMFSLVCGVPACEGPTYRGNSREFSAHLLVMLGLLHNFALDFSLPDMSSPQSLFTILPGNLLLILQDPTTVLP